MRMLVCCTCFDFCGCYWASRRRKTLITIQLTLQVVVLILLLVQICVSTSGSFLVVSTAPVFSLEWRFGEFISDVFGLTQWGDAWPSGKMHFNLNQVAFERNLARHPEICLWKPEACRSDDGGGSRFVWSIDEFTEVFLDSIDILASRPFLTDFNVIEGTQELPRGFFNEVLGIAPTDNPWNYELAVTDHGHACGGVHEYVYSNGPSSALFDCKRVWDRDGSFHGGKGRSYGPFQNMTVSLSMMLVEEDNQSWRRLCDSPQENSIWENLTDGALLRGDFHNWRHNASSLRENITWTPGVCYHVYNTTLDGRLFRDGTDPLYACAERGERVTLTLIAMLLLSFIRLCLQLIWYRRIDVKRDHGKKGLNLWLNFIAFLVSLVVFSEYHGSCLDPMQLYSVKRTNLTESQRATRLHQRAELSELGELDLDFGGNDLGAAWTLFFVTVDNYFVILLIELIIPAGKYAVPPPEPPAPLALRAPPALPEPPDNSIMQTEAQSTSPKGTGLLNFGTTIGGVLGQPHPSRNDAAGFLQPGSLHVHLVSATGLKAADLNGKSDPYVTLSLADERAKSKTSMATLDGGRAFWDEHFEFVGLRGELMKHSLHVHVFNWNRFTIDDKLGFAQLDLEQMMHNHEHTKDVELSEQGLVSLRLRWVPDQQARGKEAGAAGAMKAAPPAAGSTRSRQLQEGTGSVIVHLLRGEIEAPDKSAAIDPFVKLSLGKQTFASRTIRKTPHPRWNQQIEFKGVPRRELVSEPLRLSVYDWDPLSGLDPLGTVRRSDPLGNASIDLSPLLTSRSYFLTWNKYRTVELTRSGRLAKGQPGYPIAHGYPPNAEPEETVLGRLHLSVSWWEADDGSRWLTGTWGQLVAAAAKCIVNPLGDDPMAIPAEHHGKAWAARQYYMLTFAGPRAGECSDQPISLGWLHQMVEDGRLPRDLKVWRVEGGTAWVALQSELNQVHKAEQRVA